MGRFWGADWKPIDINFRKGGNEPRLLVVHIMQGTLVGTDRWFRNPASQVSAHFGTSRAGDLIQWVDTKDTAWHACAANSYSIGIENEGSSGDRLTDAQIHQIALVLRWAYNHHSIPLWLNQHPLTGRGLSYHALGGTEWCNHPDCPGTPIVDQLEEIVRRTIAAKL
jgi:N-acetylmuramoyl-L-alanine amidase